MGHIRLKRKVPKTSGMNSRCMPHANTFFLEGKRGEKRLAMFTKHKPRCNSQHSQHRSNFICVPPDAPTPGQLASLVSLPRLLRASREIPLQLNVGLPIAFSNPPTGMWRKMHGGPYGSSRSLSYVRRLLRLVDAIDIACPLHWLVPFVIGFVTIIDNFAGLWYQL